MVEQTIQAMTELSQKISVSCAQIETLNASTDNIGHILDVIKGISQQTNLLALYGLGPVVPIQAGVSAVLMLAVGPESAGVVRSQANVILIADEAEMQRGMRIAGKEFPYRRVESLE